ncbi:MAG: vitamin B12 dependent-methionine synthase activation domain-containing protein [Dermatophilaceae bacterium]
MTTSRSTPTRVASTTRATVHHLRQQGQHRAGIPHRSLADFVAPVGTEVDYMGGFAVTAGLELPERVAAFKDRP